MALALHRLFSTGAYVCTEGILYRTSSSAALYACCIWRLALGTSPFLCYYYYSVLYYQGIVAVPGVLYRYSMILIHYIPRILERKATSSSTINTNHALNDIPAECTIHTWYIFTLCQVNYWCSSVSAKSSNPESENAAVTYCCCSFVTGDLWLAHLVASCPPCCFNPYHYIIL